MDPVFLIGLPGVVLFGLMLGSFATALIHRIPADIPWSFPRPGKKAGEGAATGLRSMPRSACPQCGATLGVFDLIPLFSWIFLGGKCRACHAPIGWVYPAVELATALGCVGLFFGWGLSALSLLAMLAVPFLVALTVIDFRHLILPNTLNALLAGLWAVFIAAAFMTGADPAGVVHYLFMGLTGGFCYGLLSFLLGLLVKIWLKKEALGLGDVKFFAVAGLWLGLPLLPAFLMAAGILGVIMGSVYRIVIKEAYFPFGPALIAAFYLLLLLARPEFVA
jgi:prepilin signal peptidase PulO-like enzyme (type II secretory pathway)